MDNNFNILLADDDPDDRMFFEIAVDELSQPAKLNMVNDGAALMSFLTKDVVKLPNLLFLDLNMPFKSGFECLTEIKSNHKLKELPVVIYSTSSNPDMIDKLYLHGASYYIRKPVDFEKIKVAIEKVISFCNKKESIPPPKENFVILP